MASNSQIKKILIKARALEILKGVFSSHEIPIEKIRTSVCRQGKKYALTSEARNKVKVVLTGGVFDVIHAGHVFTLKKAKKLGDLLVVVVASDSIAKKLKGRKPVHTQKQRVALVSAVRFVDIAIPGSPKDRKTILKKLRPSLIVYGYDQKPFTKSVPSVRLCFHLNENKFKTSRILLQ